MTIQRPLTDAEQSIVSKGESLPNDLFQLSFQQHPLLSNSASDPHDRTEISKASSPCADCGSTTARNKYGDAVCTNPKCFAGKNEGAAPDKRQIDSAGPDNEFDRPVPTPRGMPDDTGAPHPYQDNGQGTGCGRCGQGIASHRGGKRTTPLGKSTFGQDEPDDPNAMPGHKQPKRVGTENFPTDPVHDKRMPAATRSLLSPRPWDKGSKSDSEEPDFSGAGGPETSAPRGIPRPSVGAKHDRPNHPHGPPEPEPGASFGGSNRPPQVTRTGPFDRALRKAIREAITEELSTAQSPYEFSSRQHGTKPPKPNAWADNSKYNPETQGEGAPPAEKPPVAQHQVDQPMGGARAGQSKPKRPMNGGHFLGY